MFRLRDPSGQRGPFLLPSEQFVDDYGDEIERELDSRDVVGDEIGANRPRAGVKVKGIVAFQPRNLLAWWHGATVECPRRLST